MVEVKRKHLRENERRFISEGGRKNILLEGIQAMPVCPSDNGSEDVRMVGGESLRQRRQNLFP
jgi:hypothetical protein